MPEGGWHVHAEEPGARRRDRARAARRLRRRRRGHLALPVASRTALCAAAALVAFAGNSILCRAALGEGRTDPATFTLVRLVAGAAVLCALARLGGAARPAPRGSVARAVALFAYAALFSWAYVRIPAGVGALVLFACVQLSMLGMALHSGAGPRGLQWLGIAVALVGLATLTLPGAGAPDALGTALMAASGIAWGAYSFLGTSRREATRRDFAPLAVTAAAFLLAVPLALLAFGLAGLARAGPHTDATGLALAAASGGITSGLGYAVWYAALRRLDATRAAVLQLLVPVLAAAGGVLLLGESTSARLAGASAAVLVGVGLTVRRGPRPPPAPRPV